MLKIKTSLILFLWCTSFTFTKSSSFLTPLSFTKTVVPAHDLQIKHTINVGSLYVRGGSDSTEEITNNDELELIESSENLSETTVSTSQMGPNSPPPGLIRKLFPSLPWYKLPNWLTYARCIAIPALILQFCISQSANKNIHSSLIFAIASITDFLDGYLARRWDICSPFGAFLDPVADKLMVSTALILLAGKYGPVVAIPSSIILAREIAVSALREWMASRGKRDSVKVGFQGKVKTAATMLALTIILSVPDSVGLKWNLRDMFVLNGFTWGTVMSFGIALLFLSCFVTVTSGSIYFRAAAPVLLS